MLAASQVTKHVHLECIFIYAEDLACIVVRAYPLCKRDFGMRICEEMRRVQVLS